MKNSNPRFSLKDASTVDVAAVERENSKLMKSLALAEDQVKLMRGHRVKEGYIGVLADKALREYSSSYDSATLKDNLIKIFKFLGGDVNERHSTSTHSA